MESDSNLDQHFLEDKDVAKQIVAALDVQPGDIVFEIGPGKGALTREIPACEQLIVVELDERLIPGLESLKDELKDRIKDIEIIHGNGLGEVRNHRFTKLLSNTPYAIIEPLLQAMFFRRFETAVIVVGSGTAKHMKEDNLLSFLTNAFFDIKEIEIIPRFAFYPVPKTESTILKLIPKSRSDFQNLPETGRVEPEHQRGRGGAFRKERVDNARRVYESALSSRGGIITSQNPEDFASNSDQQEKRDFFVREVYRQNDKVLKNALREFFILAKGSTKKQAKEKINGMQLSEKLLSKIVSKLSVEDWKELIKKI